MLSPPPLYLLPYWVASLTLCSCGANNTNPSVHGSDLLNGEIVGRQWWGYHSCQIPGQSGHFVWEKDLALSRLGSHSFPSSERSSRLRNKTSEDFCNSKVTHYFFHYFHSFYVTAPTFSERHGVFAHWAHSHTLKIHHVITPVINQKTCYFLQGLENLSDGGMRFETLKVKRDTSSLPTWT